MTKSTFDLVESRRLYDAGYRTGFRHGEAFARTSDAEFVESLARRVRALDDLEDSTQQTIKATLAAWNAQIARDRMRAEAEARGDSRNRGGRR